MANKRKIIVGNWKMNPLTKKEAIKLSDNIAKGLSGIKRTEIVVCPPSLFIDLLKKSSKKIIFGSQDAFYGETGAFTGAISSEMIYEIGARYVIVGHSERRAMGEKEDEINKKIKSALASGLSPILCVGEKERDQEHGYFNFVKEEIEKGLEGISRNSISKVIIAYEPIWAISSTPLRKDATPEDSMEMAIFIRKIISDMFGKDAYHTRIIYGGSVNTKNAGDFLSQGGVDGLLVGKTSLDAEKFLEIIKICEALKK